MSAEEDLNPHTFSALAPQASAAACFTDVTGVRLSGRLAIGCLAAQSSIRRKLVRVTE